MRQSNSGKSPSESVGSISLPKPVQVVESIHLVSEGAAWEASLLKNTFDKRLFVSMVRPLSGHQGAIIGGSGYSVNETITFPLKEVSNDDARLIFKSIAGYLWSRFLNHSSNTKSITDDTVKIMKFLIEHDVEESIALEAAMDSHRLGFGSLDRFQEIYGRFSRTGQPIFFGDPNYSNFGCYMRIVKHADFDVADRVFELSKFDLSKIWDRTLFVITFEPSAESCVYLKILPDEGYDVLAKLEGLIDFSENSVLLTTSRAIWELSEEQYSLISKIEETLNTGKSVLDWLDSENPDLTQDTTKYYAIEAHTSDFIDRVYVWEKKYIFAFLFARFGVDSVFESLRIANSESKQYKNFHALIAIAAFLAEGGPVETPVSWIMAINPGFEEE